MVRYFTWHDIETVLKEKRASWPDCWNDVKVYSDSVIIYYRPSQGNEEESIQYLKEIFTKNYSKQENKILIDFAQVAQYPDKKILLIDADIEAPGLTWMMEKQGNASVSYLDILSVMNFEENTEKMIEKLAELVKVSTITVTTDRTEKEQFFIPVYRSKNQTMDIFSSPERILLTKDDKYYITETLSRLGEALGAELVLVDLRAGITEYSAPFLFDPRVEKYYVTSTSLQSIKGINQIYQ